MHSHVLCGTGHLILLSLSLQSKCFMHHTISLVQFDTYNHIKIYVLERRLRG